MKSNSANILFMPVCSNCGNILHMDITWGYKDGITPVRYPYACPHCGSIFSGMTMPNPKHNESLFHYDESMYEPYVGLKKDDY